MTNLKDLDSVNITTNTHFVTRISELEGELEANRNAHRNDVMALEKKIGSLIDEIADLRYLGKDIANNCYIKRSPMEPLECIWCNHAQDHLEGYSYKNTLHEPDCVVHDVEKLSQWKMWGS